VSAAAEFSWMLPDSETELRSIFDHAPVGLAQCRARGEITLVNPVLEQMFGLDTRLGGALQFGDLLPAQDRAAGERLLREMFDGRRESFQLGTKNPVSNESAIRWMAWSVSRGNTNSGYAVLMVQEVHERETRQDEIQKNEIQRNEFQQDNGKDDNDGKHQNDEKEEKHEKPQANDLGNNHESDRRLRLTQRLEVVGRLAGGVAHDFNNLLTGVLLYCDLLAASLESDHRARKYVEEIRHAGLQATDLVRQLLAVARPTDSWSCLLSLNEIAEGMRNLLLRLIGENIRLQFHLDPNLGLIKMDHTQAQQILLNLVLNARDAMPAGGEIRVETGNCQVQILRAASPREERSAALPCVLFTVEDGGSGMDAATRARIFEPFFTTKAAQGTGLGLSTVKDIVTSNGGLIYIDSTPGRGTRVTVLLPLAPASAFPEVDAENRPGLLRENRGGTSIIREE
jgi:PAS domain S-box-containing protein